MLDRGLALPLVREPGADLTVEVRHPLEILLPTVPIEALAPDRDRLVDPPEPQRDVTELLADPDQRRLVTGVRGRGRVADLPCVPVVRRGLAVGVEPRGRVPRLLQEAHAALAHRAELVLRQPPLAAERGGPAVVLGEQRHHLVRAVSGTPLDERADLEVLPRPYRLGQHPVGDVADQHVLERQLTLPGEPRARSRNEDVLLLEAAERATQVPALRPGELRERALPECPSHHGRLL